MKTLKVLKRGKYEVSWSLDSRHLYIYDDVDQYNLVDIKFDSDLDKCTKIEKIEIIEELMKAINYGK